MPASLFKPLTLAALASFTVLGACAHPNSDRQLAVSKFYRTGFVAQQIGPDRFLVTFAGSTAMSDRVMSKNLLFRAAELTVENGFDHFVFDDRDTGRNVFRTVHSRPRHYYPGSYHSSGPGTGNWFPASRDSRFYHGGWGPYPFGRDAFFDEWKVDQIRNYRVTAIITAGRGPKPADDELAFDARSAIATWGPTKQSSVAGRR